MPYIVSARKYRPQRFEELIGQEHIANTIKNAIVKHRVGHAYLFSGPRGIGKTSAARIFAKALNCEHGPTPSHCNSCTFCREITEGRSLDLVEIDGASNRRVDEIRQLRENVRFVPSSARYKIYIIDEVHMLTTEAFNALLKTLEEPPEHVIFIFATTEVTKVPQTIRSRCQQFVFKRISIPDIIGVLKRILEDVSAEAEDRALFWIAKSASGSMRDAESVLDQMISYSEGTIKEEDVFYVLGMPSYDIYHTFARHIADEKFRECLTHLEKIVDDGFEVPVLISGLIEYFRNLYVLSVDEETEGLIDLPADDVKTMKEVLASYTSQDITNILVLLSKLFIDVKSSGIAKQLFEITLMKLVHYKEIIQPSLLLRKMEDLRYRIDKNEHPAKKKPANKTESTGIQKEIRIPHNSEEMMERIISHFSKNRRAIAEFLSRAKRTTFADNILTVYYGQDEKLCYEHVSEESARRYIEREVTQLLTNDIRIAFRIEKMQEEAEEDILTSPGVSKVIEIFKGEIVTNKKNGGEEWG
jgi:DNA polymerase-3 subunit gamma/tau